MDYVALFDRVNYIDVNGDHRTAYKGERLVEPAEGQVERLLSLDAIAPADDQPADDTATTDGTREAQLASTSDSSASPTGGADVPPAAGAEPVEEVPEGEATGDPATEPAPSTDDSTTTTTSTRRTRTSS